jgi:tripartite-type tricarboxylate transporter receptor subunit TctC
MRTLYRLLKNGLTLPALLIAGSLSATAGPYPANVVRIVVPTPAGTPPDIISRVIATELSEHAGWRIIVENRPGGLQSIAMADVLKQPADGYSILAMSVPVMVAPALLPNLGIAPDVDFSPVIQISASYTVLVTAPSLPVHSVSELIAVLKDRPDKLNFSSAGFGTPSHLIGELFKLKAGVHATHVPYPQGQQRMGDLMTSTVHFDFVTTVLAVDFISTGKLAALAVMGPNRIDAIRDVPTIVEQGFPDLVVEDWVGFAVKNGTSSEIVVRLNEAINMALMTPNVRQTFANLGARPVGGTAAEFGNLVKSQSVLWAKVVKDSGITLPK